MRIICIALALAVVCCIIAPVVDGHVRMVQGSSDTHYLAYSTENLENKTMVVYMSQNTYNRLPDQAPEGIIYKVLDWLEC
jgi:hypothetical protein